MLTCAALNNRRVTGRRRATSTRMLTVAMIVSPVAGGAICISEKTNVSEAVTDASLGPMIASGLRSAMRIRTANTATAAGRDPNAAPKPAWASRTPMNANAETIVSPT